MLDEYTHSTLVISSAGVKMEIFGNFLKKSAVYEVGNTVYKNSVLISERTPCALITKANR